MILYYSQYRPDAVLSKLGLVSPFRMLLTGMLLWSVKPLSIQGGPRALGPSTTILSTGISSLVSSPDGMIVVGTKTGRILVSHRTRNMQQDTVWHELDKEQYITNYPIYSLAVGDDLMFAGAGDRYVSVWTQKGVSFNFQGKLGPHTGWVKDLAYCQNSKLLYSIGCNCVESWDITDTSTIRHVSKRSIENSPDTGSTLSSDLLSLCLVDGHCLLSGGVDGRIHVWSLDPLEMEPVLSSRIHDGRVNAMVFSSEMEVLFSVGHDGRIVASRLGKGRLEGNSSLLVGDRSSRLTSLCLMSECRTGCRLVVGTAEGNIVCIDVHGDLNSIDMKEYSTFSIAGEPMVYSLGAVCSTTAARAQSTILVGHARGLVAVQQ